MKNINIWQESKFVKNKSGHWRGAKNTNSSWLMATLIAEWYEKRMPIYVKGDLLDLGCGKAPLYGMYSQFTDSICCADWENSLHGTSYLDVSCNLNEPLPFANASFDTIILSDVLEHIVEPKQLFAEMFRILRPNGKILLNVPFFYWVHEAPHDYYRYTQFALRKFAEDTNFNIIELSARGGIAVCFADVVGKCAALTVPFIGKGFAKILQKTTYYFFRHSSKTNNLNTAFPLVYMMILQKQ
ncbi:MAG: methyltransferase domain-containing protein [Bacteroidetes bacterium]|nr:methyltransferase domain-containing protein [Bacteroidota bacterium]MCL2303285.1 methyltransferase domain-containing protein [Lentimicrobiaceae bacterium]